MTHDNPRYDKPMKVAWFEGSCRDTTPYEPYRTMDEIARKAQTGEGDFQADPLTVVLVPADTDLTTIYGDDWNDAPANCNAGEPYYDRIPGAVRLVINLGDVWP